MEKGRILVENAQSAGDKVKVNNGIQFYFPLDRFPAFLSTLFYKILTWFELDIILFARLKKAGFIVTEHHERGIQEWGTIQ
jgi:hypothetical protein